MPLSEDVTKPGIDIRGRGGTVNHGAQRIKAFISKSSCGNSVAASSVLMFGVTPFIN